MSRTYAHPLRYRPRFRWRLYLGSLALGFGGWAALEWVASVTGLN